MKPKTGCDLDALNSTSTQDPDLRSFQNSQLFSVNISRTLRRCLNWYWCCFGAVQTKTGGRVGAGPTGCYGTEKFHAVTRCQFFQAQEHLWMLNLFQASWKVQHVMLWFTCSIKRYSFKLEEQARKLQSYFSPKLLTTRWVIWVKSKATSIAKKP